MAKAGCAHCRPLAERRRLDQVEKELTRAPAQPRSLHDVSPVDGEVGATAIAARAATCHRCTELIWVGDTIRQAWDGWIHEGCIRKRGPRRRPT